MVALAFLLLAQAGPDSSLVEMAVAAAPFETVVDLYDWLGERRPMTAGHVPIPGMNPGAPQALYILERDSTVWIQSPDGSSIVLDTYVPYFLGTVVDEEMRYSGDPEDGIGYGFENDRFILRLSKGMPQQSALALLILIPLAVGATVYWLWRGLRLATERGEQLTESRRRLADGREAERMSLARELHDGPLQDLQALRMRLGVLERSAARGETPSGDALAPVQEDLLRVVRELRALSEGLRPPVLGPFGLAAALRALASRVRETHPALSVEFDLQSDGTSLSESARIALYRVAQEAINNAAVHSPASHVTVSYREADKVHLDIEDDGGGFDVPSDLYELEVQGHLGVASMRERAESIGGSFSIRSRASRGVHVKVEAPLSVLATHTPSPS